MKNTGLIMRILVVVFIAISVVIAIIQYKSNVTFIAQLMGVSWGALAGAFLAPFLYGLYWKGATPAACWVSFIFSTVVMLANMLVRSSFPILLQSPINAGAFCMIAGLVIVPVVSRLSRRSRTKRLWKAPSRAMMKKYWFRSAEHWKRTDFQQKKGICAGHQSSIKVEEESMRECTIISLLPQ